MSTKTRSDTVVVRDRASRRQFMRAGAAFVVAGGALVGTGGTLAADCDQNQAQKTRCTDQDSGEQGDPEGCGRCGRLVPTSGAGAISGSGTVKTPRVKKISI